MHPEKAVNSVTLQVADPDPPHAHPRQPHPALPWRKTERAMRILKVCPEPQPKSWASPWAPVAGAAGGRGCQGPVRAGGLMTASCGY